MSITLEEDAYFKTLFISLTSCQNMFSTLTFYNINTPHYSIPFTYDIKYLYYNEEVFSIAVNVNDVVGVSPRTLQDYSY